VSEFENFLCNHKLIGSSTSFEKVGVKTTGMHPILIGCGVVGADLKTQIKNANYPIQKVSLIKLSFQKKV